MIADKAILQLTSDSQTEKNHEEDRKASLVAQLTILQKTNTVPPKKSQPHIERQDYLLVTAFKSAKIP